MSSPPSHPTLCPAPAVPVEPTREESVPVWSHLVGSRQCKSGLARSGPVGPSQAMPWQFTSGRVAASGPVTPCHTVAVPVRPCRVMSRFGSTRQAQRGLVAIVLPWQYVSSRVTPGPVGSCPGCLGSACQAAPSPVTARLAHSCLPVAVHVATSRVKTGPGSACPALPCPRCLAALWQNVSSQALYVTAGRDEPRQIVSEHVWSSPIWFGHVSAALVEPSLRSLVATVPRNP